MGKKQVITNTCSKRVKIARVTKELTQVELAAAVSVDCGLDLNQRSISLIERGKRFVRDVELLALARVLDVTPYWLMFGENVPEEYR